MHCCYCCDDADAAVRFLEQGIGLSARATSKGIRADGSPLGILRTVESDVCLVYDPRGGRVSPAIEVARLDRSARRRSALRPSEPGRHPGHRRGRPRPRHRARSTRRRRRLGRRARRRRRLLGGAAAAVRAPDGVTFDVVEAPAVADVQFAHLRVTCSDLDRSVEWYRTVGYALVEEPSTIELDGRGSVSVRSPCGSRGSGSPTSRSRSCSPSGSSRDRPARPTTSRTTAGSTAWRWASRTPARRRPSSSRPAGHRRASPT